MLLQIRVFVFKNNELSWLEDIDDIKSKVLNIVLAWKGATERNNFIKLFKYLGFLWKKNDCRKLYRPNSTVGRTLLKRNSVFAELILTGDLILEL